MTLRISGLASGIDTESVIKDLMRVERISVDKVKQQRQLVEWQREALADINTKLRSFRNETLFSFNKVSTLSAKLASVSGNTAAVSAKALGNAQEGTISIQVDRKASAATLTKEIFNADGAHVDPNNLISSEFGTDLVNSTFSINGEPITIEESDTLASIIEKINKSTDVTAFYDEFTGKISMVSKNTGASNGITFNGAFIDELGLTPADVKPGENAIVHINGIETQRDSNTFIVNGVEITLNSISEGTISTIEVKTDTESIINSVKEFVEAYNEVIKELTEQLDAKRYRDYPPLTDDQKKEMTEREIELWEEKAKSGLLSNEIILERAYNELRSATSAFVSNGSDINSLFAIGITTGHYSEKGKLHLNEDKLREALEKDPDAVVSLFTAKGNDDADSSDVGIAQRMYNSLENTLKAISEKAGTSVYADSSGFRSDALLSKRLTEFDKQIERMNDRLLSIEDRYYRQFAAMEAAIQRMSSQSAFLMSQFGLY